MTETSNLWAAVDAITKPTRVKIERDTESEWRTAVEADQGWEHGTVCSVAVYRATLDRLRASESAYGNIPPLWDQAVWALTTGSEQGTGTTPLRERSPADLALMETLADIREAVQVQLEGRGVKPIGTVPRQMRSLASTLGTLGNQGHIDWWAFRFESWTRVLRTHLNALEHQPKDVYLRNTACPTCKTRQVTIEREGEARVVPSLLIDFSGGWIRAATCQSCGDAWWRGDDMGRLVTLLESDTPDTRSA